MTLSELHERIRRIREVAETTLDWIENPADEAPPAVLADEVVTQLEKLEADLEWEMTRGA